MKQKYFIDSQIKKGVNENNCDYIKLGNLVNDVPTNKTIPNKEIKEGIYDYYSCSRNSFKSDKYDYEGEYLIHGSRGSTISESVFYINGKFSLGTSVFISTSKENSNIKFIYYYLKTNHEKIFSSIITGGSIPMISKKVYYDILIPIPKLEIQESITQKMNELSDKIKILDNDIVFIDNLMKEIMQSTYQ